jgi:hypothetical protein
MPTRDNRTTIALDPATRDELFNRKNPTDSYDDVVCRLLDAAGEATEN